MTTMLTGTDSEQWPYPLVRFVNFLFVRTVSICYCGEIITPENDAESAQKSISGDVSTGIASNLESWRSLRMGLV